MKQLFTFGALLFAAGTAHAACSDPTGVEGEQVYNSSFKVMQFCNGTNWISMASSYAASGGGSGAPDAVLEDQKPNGTNGGTFTAGAWQTRDLNTEVRDPDNLLSLSSNTFTPSVNGWVEWSAPSYRVAQNQSRLFNITDNSVVGYGTSEFLRSDDRITSDSIGGGPVEAGKSYRIEHRSAETLFTRGFGDAAGQGGTEVYTRVKFWRD